MDGYLGLQLIILVVHLLISFLIIWLVYKLFKKLIGLLSNPIEGTNTSSLSLFLSFGITLIFFKGIVTRSIRVLWRFLISPLDSIELIRTYLSDSYLNDANLDSDIVNFLFSWSEQLKYTLTSTLMDLNYTGIIIFLTFWLLISLIIGEIERDLKDKDPKESRSKLSNLTGNTAIKNTLTILIFVFSIYLCVSSIIAVPEFQNLETTSNTSNIYKEFTEELENQRLFSKESLTMTKDSILDEIVNITEFDDILRKLEESIESYNTKLDTYWTRDEKAKIIALNRLKAAVNQKMGSKERIRYRLELGDWYNAGHDWWTERLSNLQSELIFANNNIKEILSDETYKRIDTVYVQRIDTVYVPTDTTRTAYKLELNNRAKSRLNLINDDLLEFNSMLNYSLVGNIGIGKIPEKPQIGEKFGIFNIISGWLLRTESLSLALIVGLFGFGLLGSISSTFIRKRLKNEKSSENGGELVIYDLRGIIINGISAAIVVFLAVKSAIVVFSTDGDTLNPYMLFFTCLVAAVFSEDVWSWARTKLNQNLGNNNGKDGEKGEEGGNVEQGEEIEEKDEEDEGNEDKDKDG